MKSENNCGFRIKIILSRPRNPDNIGAAARAMANFGLEELALAAPYLPAWTETLETASTAGSGLLPGAPRSAPGGREGEPVWLLDRARAAVGAAAILRSARVFPAVAEAASDCVLLLGTSALQRRSPDRDVISLQDLRGWLVGRLSGGGARKVGVLFGSEKTGLANSELSRCHAVVNIPTCEKQPSVNLGQAVALVCYELYGRGEGKGPRAARPPSPSVGQTERLAAEICALLDEIKGPGAGKRLEEDIRRGLLDARLTKGAAGALKALLRRASGKQE